MPFSIVYWHPHMTSAVFVGGRKYVCNSENLFWGLRYAFPAELDCKLALRLIDAARHLHNFESLFNDLAACLSSARLSCRRRQRLYTVKLPRLLPHLTCTIESLPSAATACVASTIHKCCEEWPCGIFKVAAFMCPQPLREQVLKWLPYHLIQMLAELFVDSLR